MNNLRGVNPAETPGMCDWKAGVRQAEKSQMAPICDGTDDLLKCSEE